MTTDIAKYGLAGLAVAFVLASAGAAWAASHPRPATDVFLLENGNVVVFKSIKKPDVLEGIFSYTSKFHMAFKDGYYSGVWTDTSGSHPCSTKQGGQEFWGTLKMTFADDGESLSALRDFCGEVDDPLRWVGKAMR